MFPNLLARTGRVMGAEHGCESLSRFFFQTLGRSALGRRHGAFGLTWATAQPPLTNFPSGKHLWHLARQGAEVHQQRFAVTSWSRKEGSGVRAPFLTAKYTPEPLEARARGSLHCLRHLQA